MKPLQRKRCQLCGWLACLASGITIFNGPNLAPDFEARAKKIQI
jgi:hypothetical protein